MTHDVYATTELAANTPESTLGASSGSQSVALSQIGRYTVLGQLCSGGQPAYCFLVAMNPDGVKQLCYPSHSDQAQSEPIAELRFPAEQNAAFGLTDGVGQQDWVNEQRIDSPRAKGPDICTIDQMLRVY